MSSELFDSVSLWWFYLAFATAWALPTLLVIQLITPRKIVDRYFKQPHFNFGETVVLSHFPGSLLRTIVFMGGCISERYRTGRKLDSYLGVVPKWYVAVSRFYMTAVFLHLFSVFGIMFVLLVWT